MEISKCRSCEINEELTAGKSGLHQLVDIGFYCLVCFKSTKCIHHDHDELLDLSGSSYECNLCHNYILYEDHNNIWKDEIYFEDGSLLIRDVEDNKSYYTSNIKTITLPMITFSSMQELSDRLEILTTFS